MLASTEVILIEILFSLGALIALGGLGGLIWAKVHQRALRPPMAIIVCGIGIVIIASLLNVLLFKTYAGVRVKKNQYYEITSLTTNMRASLATTHAKNQPVSPQSRKASKNVTYLIDHTDQPAKSKRWAKAAQRQFKKTHPNATVVTTNYRRILRQYFSSVTQSSATVTKLTQHAIHQVTKTPHTKVTPKSPSAKP
ncbi:hypothetical protein [Levilactobacillus suantsaii]|uniref:Uncharacterized protein n=1 Tax=Levilactobacillus suantsaii TaxID=2292255 RepID=A0A4Q0VFT9_9LACO|nr:hypothetical protein [Levilactobacillus suantsaii]QMU07313.1 hypothetical protein H3M12_07390 [Levilactobacillus suantsaii]RXI77032.1 hypothetical protein DXH47_09765 [Levilactobacillus suantsaii]